MTTLAALKAEIADDLDRPDLATAIASEINKAIGFHQNSRFYFNETRDCVIATVDGQRIYSSEDVSGVVYRVVVDADGEIVVDGNGDIVIFQESDGVVSVGDKLSSFIEVDQVLIEGLGFELEEMSPSDWEIQTASGTEKGRPRQWCYYGGGFGLYPIPDAQYAIRFIGHVKKAAPATDAEAGNVWMTYAFDLIRSRVCARLALRKIRDPEIAATHTAMEQEEKLRLGAETASKVGTGYLTPTEF